MTSKKGTADKKKPAKKAAPKKATKKRDETIDEAVDRIAKIPMDKLEEAIADADTEVKKALKKAAPEKKSTKKNTSKKKVEEKSMETYKFKSEDGTLTSIPKIGKVNVIELRQEKWTDYLIMRLPKELTLKYSIGTVRTRYALTKSNVCVMATKYRGDAIDPNRPNTISECYTLNWCPHFTEVSADLEHISKGISDEDIRLSLLALDESKALVFRNKWIVQKEARESADELFEEQTYNRREAATRYAAKIADEAALGRSAVGEDVSTGAAVKWAKRNWLILVILFVAILYISSLVMPRG